MTVFLGERKQQRTYPRGQSMHLRVSIVLPSVQMEGLLLPCMGGVLGTWAPLNSQGSSAAGRGDKQDEAECGSRKLQEFYFTRAEPERCRAEEPLLLRALIFLCPVCCLLSAWSSLTRTRVRYTIQLRFAYINHM